MWEPKFTGEFRPARQCDNLRNSNNRRRATHQPVLQAETDSREAASQPSFILWSEKRIKGFQDSLNQSHSAPLAVLRIPRFHLEAPLLEGTDDVTLNRGVGRIEGTAHPGEDGNMGIAGHRDSFFRVLKDIKVGDRVDLEGLERSDTYVVDQVEIVDPSDVSVLRPRSKPSLTLVTCYPFYFIGSAPRRYIVHALRQDSKPQADIATPSMAVSPL